MKLYRFALTLSFLVAAALVQGCGGGNSPILKTDPTGSLSASPATVTSGSSSTLSWATTNASSASIDNSVGAVSPVASGSVKVTPAKTTTYTLTVVGTDGNDATATATVTVTAPQTTVTITCHPLVQIGIQRNVVPPTTYVCTGKASDGKAVSYSVTSGSGLNVDAKTGALETTATDSDIADNKYLSATVTATSSDGTAKASANVLVTDWFLAEGNGIVGVHLVTSRGKVVSTIQMDSNGKLVECGASALTRDHLNFACLKEDNTGFIVYALPVSETGGTVTLGATQTGAIKLVIDYGAIANPWYSPDGKFIVYGGGLSSDTQGVYVVASNGKTVETLLSPEGSGSHLTSFPHFAADGKSIHYEHFVNGRGQVWNIAADGSNPTVVINHPCGAASFPTADGKYLMCWMNNAIYRANTDGSDLELVIQASASDPRGALPEAISPDGKRIMYLVTDPANGWWYVWVANIDGSNQTKITPTSGTLTSESWGN